jgi:type IV secretory pathway TrbF-like protein
MGFTSAMIGSAMCVIALLLSSQFTPVTAQQDQTMTATASALSKSDACTASEDHAYGLCMARGFFNIKSVSCDCNQRNIPGAPSWECAGTATCKK